MLVVTYRSASEVIPVGLMAAGMVSAAGALHGCFELLQGPPGSPARPVGWRDCLGMLGDVEEAV